jgi:hypothetical protein
VVHLEAELAAAVEEQLALQRRSSDLEAALEAQRRITEQERGELSGEAAALATQLRDARAAAAEVGRVGWWAALPALAGQPLPVSKGQGGSWEILRCVQPLQLSCVTLHPWLCFRFCCAAFLTAPLYPPCCPLSVLL